MTKHLSSYFFLFFISLAFAQDSKNKAVSLPETVFSEWQTASNTGEYNGLLIHRDFIEFGYRPFMYQDVKKTGDATYSISAKDNLGNHLNCELTVISKDTIQLKRGNNPQYTYVSHKDPIGSERTTFAEVPNTIKKKWFTTDGNNALEFDLSNDQFTFKNKTYELDDLVNFKSNGNNEYRFIVKNKNAYQMFYFKNWDENYLQVGFNGEFGDLYKAGQDYPDQRIDNVSAYLNSIVPKELRGDWLKADGSNVWAFSFHYDYAVLDKTLWNYTSVNRKGKLYVITLDHNGEQKTLYAKPNQDATVSFGTDKKDLTAYTTDSVNNPNFKLANDVLYTKDDLFKIDSATYSGIVKGINAESSETTGIAYVRNVFSGDQDSYLLKIQDDGSFSVKFPLYYPQQIFVRFPNYTASVFVEPGKETWQFINPLNDVSSFFAGDCAQINTDLSSLQFIIRDRTFYTDVVTQIDDLSPEAYKQKCYDHYEKQIRKRDSVNNTRFLSSKAQQIFAVNLDYQLYENILSYDINSRDRDSKKIDADYISFITSDIYNNRLAVVSPEYYIFINRLAYSNPISRNFTYTYPTVLELAEILKSDNVELSTDEKELLAKHEKFTKENAVALKNKKISKTNTKKL